MAKERENEPKGCNMEELHAAGLSHFKGGTNTIFHHKIIKILDHGVVSFVHTNQTSRITTKLEFV
jgi:hypothetical protein